MQGSLWNRYAKVKRGIASHCFGSDTIYRAEKSFVMEKNRFAKSRGAMQRKGCESSIRSTSCNWVAQYCKIIVFKKHRQTGDRDGEREEKAGKGA